MLTHVLSNCRRSSLYTSLTGKLVKVFRLNLARNAVDQCLNVCWVKSVAFDCDKLPTRCKAFSSINWIDDTHSFSLVAGSIGVIASQHCRILLVSMSSSISKQDTGWHVGCDSSHKTTELTFGVSWQVSVLFNETFKINTVPIDTNLDEGELRKKGALFALSAPWIDPKRYWGTWVDDWWRQRVKLGSVCSAQFDLTY